MGVQKPEISADVPNRSPLIQNIFCWIETHLALHLPLVKDHAARAGAIADDPGHVATKPESLKGELNNLN